MAIATLSMDGRFTMANMAIEAGAKAGIFRVDGKILAYLKLRAKRPYTVYEPDDDAEYAQVIEYDVSKLEPQVSLPHSPANAKPVSQVGDIKIEQAVIGSCTNGRLDDLASAAEILKDRKIAAGKRMIVIPASEEVYLEALRAGYLETFIKAGAIVERPGCGPCMGTHMGVPAEGEVSISSDNRNFRGRMGTKESEVYLANPAVVAASAVAGVIEYPENIK